MVLHWIRTERRKHLLGFLKASANCAQQVMKPETRIRRSAMSAENGIAVVRPNTEEVQGRGNFEVFEELFDADVDHTPQPGGFTADRDGARNLYRALRAAFPDFHAEIHWQISDGDRVTKHTMVRTKVHSGDWPRPGAGSISRR
jgi:hypothetical protein